MKFPILSLAATAFNKDQLLDSNLPQIALVGRSNVGKSSLLNALADRRQLAKTSSTPGKTRSINYYSLLGEGFAAEEEADPTAFVVDLPGYGYARCSKEERNAWARLIEHYLCNTPGLRGVALLIDSRHTPQELDIQMAESTFNLGLPLLLVLTKLDRSKVKEREACIKGWKKILGKVEPVLTSSEKKRGIEDLWQAIISNLRS